MNIEDRDGASAPRDVDSGVATVSSERREFAGRIAEIIQMFGSASALSKAVGVSEGAIRKWLRGHAEPGRDNLVAIARAANVSVAWLACGDGAMRPGMSGHDYAFFGTSHEASTPPDGSNISHTDCIAFRSQWLSQTFGVDPSRLLLVRAFSDSMRPTIQEGDVILVDTNRNRLDEDGILLLQTRGKMMLRRVQIQLNGRILVTADNPYYQAQPLEVSDPNGPTALGRVIWIGSSVK